MIHIGQVPGQATPWTIQATISGSKKVKWIFNNKETTFASDHTEKSSSAIMDGGRLLQLKVLQDCVIWKPVNSSGVLTGFGSIWPQGSHAIFRAVWSSQDAADIVEHLFVQ